MNASSANVKLAECAIGFLSSRDFDALKIMCAPDIRAEGPYHPIAPAQFDGIDAVIRDFRQLRVFDTFKLDIVQIFDTAGGTVIVEARSLGTHKDDSRPVYANHYLFVLSFEGGKLKSWREFYNPLEAMKQGYGASPPR